MYKFPRIESIQDVLPHVKGRSEFIVAERDYFDIVNYVVSTPTTFPPVTSPEDAILRECRGIAFDKKGKTLSRSLHKFFNLGEREETLPRNVDFKKAHSTMLKLDGSMIRPLYIEQFDGSRLGTKMGITDVAMQAEVYVSEHVGYFQFFRECLALGLTPTFEWTSPKNQIVILYDKPELTLIAVRENVSGDYMKLPGMEDFADEFNIRTLRREDSIESLDQFVEAVRARDDIEGLIVRFDDGHMLKIKADRYVLMHKSKEIVSNDRLVYKLILDEEVDDIKPRLLENEIRRVEEMENRFANVVEKLTGRIEGIFAEHRNKTKKDFALESDKMDPVMRKAVFTMLGGGTALDEAKFILRKNLSNNKSFEENLKGKYGVKL